MRAWFATLPVTLGRATLVASLRLWLGWSPARSGVYSAGNGPAMRCGLLGVVCDDLDQLTDLVRSTTLITHTDPKAFYSAHTVALSAHFASRRHDFSAADFFDWLQLHLPHSDTPAWKEWENWVHKIQMGLRKHANVLEFVTAQGWSQGVSGYIYHTVPAALFAWLRHPNDFATCVQSVIRCGGDTDTTAAIVGGIAGSAVGAHGIPQAWVQRLGCWPITLATLQQLSHYLRLATENSPAIVDLPKGLCQFPTSRCFLRNLALLPLILLHLGRRCLPKRLEND